MNIKIKEYDAGNVEISNTMNDYTDSIIIDIDDELDEVIKKLQKFSNRNERLVIKGVSQPVKNAGDDLDEIKYSARDVTKIINAEGNKFMKGSKDDPMVRAIFLYMADLFYKR